MSYSNLKLIQKSAFLGVAFGLVSISNADEVHFVGSTLGRFDSQSYAAANVLFALSFSDSIFDNTTVNGSLDLGGNPSPGSNFNNLGSLSLSTTPHDYNGHTFDLMVTFTAPVVIDGGSSTTFSTNLIGQVSNSNGGVFVDFDNTPKTFTYSNANATGSFTMFMNDLSIAPGHTAALSAHFTGVEHTPEPASMVSLVLGMIGLVGLRRKKRP